MAPARASRKRNSSLNEPDEDDDWDPEEEGDRSRALKRGKVEGALPGPQATFACPFFKMNPIRHHSCLFYKMSKISYVKQHLKRTHRAPKWRCAVCQDVFPDQPSYDRHQTTRECESSTPRARQDEMDESQWGEIDRLTSRRPGATAESMWYAMFSVLFPGTPLPATPYVESGISEMTKHFRDFVKERGPAILKSHLQASGAWQTMADQAAADPDVLLQFVMTSGIDIVFESWGQSMDSAGLHVSPAPEGSFSQVPPRSQLPATSFVPPIPSMSSRTPTTAMEPPASPTVYYAGGAQYPISTAEPPMRVEPVSSTTPRSSAHPGYEPRPSSDGSVSTGLESYVASPTHRDLSISALTEQTGTAGRGGFSPPKFGE